MNTDSLNKPDSMAEDDQIDQILATAKAKVVEAMNATTVAPNDKEIELTHTGEFKDGDIVNVRIDNHAGHSLYSGTIKGYKLQIDRPIPYKIDVGTQISLLSWPEAKAAINAYTTNKIIEARIDTISDMILECYDHDNPLEIANELIQERKRLEEALNHRKD